MDIIQILEEGIKRTASDIHIVCVLPPILRVHGRLIKLKEFGEVTPEISKKMLLRILNDEYEPFHALIRRSLPSLRSEPLRCPWLIYPMGTPSSE